MRHRKSFNHLGRKSAHRKAMLSNMAASLILHKRINTTVAKAKALRSFVEPLITKAKDDSTHSRREVFSALQNKEAVSELFREVSVKVGDRPGGYTRILKTGTRLGDNAEMCIMELVDFNENMLQDSDSKKKTTRRRRSKKKNADEVVADVKSVEPTEEIVEETVVEETKAEKEEVIEPEEKEAEKPVEEVKTEEVKSEEKDTSETKE